MEDCIKEIKIIYEQLEDTVQKIINNNVFVSYKDKGELVTNIDFEIEKTLIKVLQGVDEIPCLSEESFQNVESSNYWIIDPIDGTTNFVHGYPSYCVSIAKVKNNITEYGIVYNLATKEGFIGIKGHGAYRVDSNGYFRINVSDVSIVSESIIGFGCPYDKSKTEYLFYIGNNLLKSCRDLKRNGPASLDLCYVACGRLDAYFELDLKEWDYKAGKLILEESGGALTDWTGKTILKGKSNILATNDRLHSQMMSYLNLK